MAYETGSTTGAADFIAKLRAFITANGWTVQDAGNDSWGSGAFVASRGLCHVYFGPYSYSETFYYVTSTRVTATVYGLRMGLGTSAGSPASIQRPSGMPGGVAAEITFGLGTTAGQFSAYHFFADEAGNIAGTMEVVGDRYHHFSFGEIDRRGLTHSGGAYCSAQWNIEYNTQSGSGGGGNSPWDRPCLGGGAANLVVGVSAAAGGWSQLRLIDALPSGVGYPEGDRVIGPSDILAIRSIYDRGETLNEFAFTSSPAWALIDFADASRPLPVGNAVPMAALPFFVVSSSGRICYVGDLPSCRRLRIESMVPGDELTIASDTWKVFPQFRKTDPSLINDPLALTSGWCGIAFKKVA